jgi:GTPase SAR1 family protein
LLLVGNKSDLEHRRSVSQEQATKFAQKYNMRYFETSAAKDTNVETAFKTILIDVYQGKPHLVYNQTNHEVIKGIRIPTDDKPIEPSSGYCC